MGPFDTRRGPREYRKKFFFRILLNLTSLDVKFDAHSKYHGHFAPKVPEE